MNFAAMVLAAGVAGALLAYNVQGPAVAAGSSFAAMQVSKEITGSLPTDLRQSPTNAMRMIDLRSGKVCKLARPDTTDTSLTRAPIGPDCATSPYLERVAYWRSTEDGALIMADRQGETVLEFAPGDGALYESVFPANEIITIVPARG